MGLLNEYKAFILRGNVVDLAVGVIIGAAFGTIVTSLVNDILMPPIGWATGGVNFEDLAVELPGKMLDPALKGKPAEEVAKLSDAEKYVPVKVKYGSFLQAVINFLIVGLCLFFVVKGMNTLMRRKQEQPKAPELTTSEKLLTEIRDAVKNRG